MSPQEHRPSAGDMTGQLKAQQARDAQQELRDKTAQTSLATAIEADAQATGVFDPHTQTRIDDGVAEVEEVPPLFPENGAPFFRPPVEERERVLTGYESEDEMVQLLAAKPRIPAIPKVLLRSPMVKIRVNQDIEDMTYGFRNGEPNNMTFREGFVYEVDINVAEHLNDRNLIGQWIG